MRRIVLFFCAIAVPIAGAVWIHFQNSADRPPVGEAPVADETAAPATTMASPFTERDDLPCFRGGGPLTGQAAPLGPPPMKLVWSHRVPDAGPILAAAAIVGSYAYVADSRGNLSALDLATGNPRWTNTTPDGFESTPLVVGNRVIVGDTVGVVRAIAADTGQSVWTFAASRSIHCSPNISGQTVLLADDSGVIYALEAATGHQLWSAQALDRINSAAAIGPGDWPVAYFCSCDQHVRALSVGDGAVRFDIDAEAICPGSPALVGNRLIFGTGGVRVLCVDAGDGHRLWTFTGAAEENVASEENMVFSSPAVADGLVVVGSRDEKVHALDLKTGVEKWSFKTRGYVDSSPALSSGRVYVASEDRHLYVLDLHTGRRLWQFSADHMFEASPAIAHGVLIIGDHHGMVYCFKPGE